LTYGGVCRDQVAAAHLLQELKEDTQREAVEELILAHGEYIAHLGSAATSFFQGEFDATDLGSDFGIVEIQAFEARQTAASLFHTSFSDEPTRALGDGEHSYHRKDRDNRWNGEGNAPLQGQVVLLEKAEVDPCLENIAQTDEAAVQHNVLTAVSGRRALRLPDWHCGTQGTDTPTEDETADDELRELEACALEDLANESTRRSKEDDFPSSEYVSKPGAGKRAKEGANGEGSNDSTLFGRVATLFRASSIDSIDLGKMVIPIPKRQETSNARLVISEKHKSRKHDEQKLRRLEGFAAESHVGGSKGRKKEEGLPGQIEQKAAQYLYSRTPPHKTAGMWAPSWREWSKRILPASPPWGLRAIHQTSALRCQSRVAVPIHRIRKTRQKTSPAPRYGDHSARTDSDPRMRTRGILRNKYHPRYD
jgi:hypothetical protein